MWGKKPSRLNPHGPAHDPAHGPAHDPAHGSAYGPAHGPAYELAHAPAHRPAHGSVHGSAHEPAHGLAHWPIPGGQQYGPAPKVRPMGRLLWAGPWAGSYGPAHGPAHEAFFPSIPVSWNYLTRRIDLTADAHSAESWGEGQRAREHILAANIA